MTQFRAGTTSEVFRNSSDVGLDLNAARIKEGINSIAHKLPTDSDKL